MADHSTPRKARLPAVDPRALLTFRAVCETGSISAAARVLNLSQPSVSNTIALLESRLGTVLFERGRGGIVLTREGLVAREAHEADGRGQWVAITPAGRALQARMWKVYARSIEQHIGAKLDDKAAATLADLLSRLTTAR